MATNRPERLWLAGAAALGVLIMLIGWVFLISPQRDETSTVEGQTADAQLQNFTLQSRIAALQAASKNRAKYTADLALARQALPTQSAMSPFLRSVQSIAAASSTRVTALSIGEAKAAATSSGAKASGIFAIPIDATVVGSPANVDRFLVRLQRVQPRAVLLSGVTRTDGGMLVKMTAFYAPDASAIPSPSSSPSPTAPTPGA